MMTTFFVILDVLYLFFETCDKLLLGLIHSVHQCVVKMYMIENT